MKPGRPGCCSFLTNTGFSIAKLEDSWNWYYLDDKGTSRKFDTTGAHVVYRVLDVPKSPWYDGDPRQHPWVNALDLTIKGARTEGMTQFPHPIVRLTDFVFSEYRLSEEEKAEAQGGANLTISLKLR